jgi:hypothetical protein
MALQMRRVDADWQQQWGGLKPPLLTDTSVDL